jgi:hypothetical protein
MLVQWAQQAPLEQPEQLEHKAKWAQQASPEQPERKE